MQNLQIKQGMIKLTAYYKKKEGSHFNLEYYLNSHIPMIQRVTGGAIKLVTVDEGLSAGEPGSEPPYIYVGQFYFNSMSDLENYLLPKLPEIMSDVPNYTDLHPVFQINKVLI